MWTLSLVLWEVLWVRGPDLPPATQKTQPSGLVLLGFERQWHLQEGPKRRSKDGLTWGMAREQLRQVYSITAYSCPSSSISFWNGKALSARSKNTSTTAFSRLQLHHQGCGLQPATAASPVGLLTKLLLRLSSQAVRAYDEDPIFQGSLQVIHMHLPVKTDLIWISMKARGKATHSDSFRWNSHESYSLKDRWWLMGTWGERGPGWDG